MPKRISSFKIKGLGTLPSFNPFNEEHEYIFLSRKEKEMDEKIDSIFSKLVIDELINVSKEKYDGVKPNETLPESASKSCLWKDGALSYVYVDALPESIDHYSKKKIIFCKHNNGRTGSDQSFDLSKTFPKKQQKNKEMVFKYEADDIFTKVVQTTLAKANEDYGLNLGEKIKYWN